ncbi:hypothetical protein FOZ60_006306 [Perkinsus olseni]|uniref:Uncharacterized protein n=1 Tax=Perkinsus olseni TaxID=32597 RepID=A0A7J6NP15_PEROL|nr:hypothetical protein FOZ60_006306 [Perkinsus olseni]
MTYFYDSGCSTLWYQDDSDSSWWCKWRSVWYRCILQSTASTTLPAIKDVASTTYNDSPETTEVNPASANQSVSSIANVTGSVSAPTTNSITTTSTRQQPFDVPGSSSVGTLHDTAGESSTIHRRLSGLVR